MKKKEYSKLDLIWIIPEIIGEMFLILVLPIMFIREMTSAGIFSEMGLIYLALSMLLLGQWKTMNGINNLGKVKW